MQSISILKPKKGNYIPISILSVEYMMYNKKVSRNGVGIAENPSTPDFLKKCQTNLFHKYYKRKIL